MTITLATLSRDIGATAESDGWWLRGPPAADLTTRGGWPTSLLVEALQVEQMLELGLATARNGAVLVPWDLFGDAVAADFSVVLGGTESSPLMLVIDRLDDIGSPTFAYRYAFRLGSYDTSVHRAGYFVEQGAERRTFRLDTQTFVLVEAMDRFNVLPPEAKTKQESWLTFAAV